MWELENVVKTSMEHEDSFFIPSEIERNNQEIENEVRLHFILKNPSENEPRAERMWVKITNRKNGKKTSYAGVLINKPVYIKDLQANDIIEFDADNIAQVIVKKDDPSWIDSSEKYAVVSKMCMEKNSVIRFMYREKPDRNEDSGWRMFTGLEDDDYSNDPENLKLVNVGYLLSKDPTLLTPLKKGYGAVFEREEKWEKIEDWTPEA